MATDTLETTVKYTKDRAVINMSIEKYAQMCKLYNIFSDAMDGVSEFFDLHMSEIQQMDNLRYCMKFNLGFVKINEKNYHSDYKIPDRSKK